MRLLTTGDRGNPTAAREIGATRASANVGAPNLGAFSSRSILVVVSSGDRSIASMAERRSLVWAPIQESVWPRPVDAGNRHESSWPWARTHRARSRWRSCAARRSAPAPSPSSPPSIASAASRTGISPGRRQQPSGASISSVCSTTRSASGRLPRSDPPMCLPPFVGSSARAIWKAPQEQCSLLRTFSSAQANYVMPNGQRSTPKQLSRRSRRSG